MVDDSENIKFRKDVSVMRERIDRYKSSNGGLEEHLI